MKLSAYLLTEGLRWEGTWGDRLVQAQGHLAGSPTAGFPGACPVGFLISPRLVNRVLGFRVPLWWQLLSWWALHAGQQLTDPGSSTCSCGRRPLMLQLHHGSGCSRRYEAQKVGNTGWCGKNKGEVERGEIRDPSCWSEGGGWDMLRIPE